MKTPGVIDPAGIVGADSAPLAGFDYVDKGFTPALGKPGSAPAIAAMDMAGAGLSAVLPTLEILAMTQPRYQVLCSAQAARSDI